MHAVQRPEYAVAGRAVLVSGAGPVGLALAYLAILMGAAHVIVVEPNPYRRAPAEKLGALAMPPRRRGRPAVPRPDRPTGRISTSPSSAPALRPPCRPCSRPCAAKESWSPSATPAGQPKSTPLPTSTKKGITLRGIFGRRLWETWEQTLPLLDSGQLDLDWLITHRTPLDKADEAVDLLTGEACKVLLVPALR